MYRELFRHQLDPGLIDEIRAATNGNYALGSSAFEAQAAAAWLGGFHVANPGALES